MAETDIKEKLYDEPLIEGKQTYGSLGETIDKVILVGRIHPKWFYFTLFVATMGAIMMVTTISYLIYKGIGIWGNEIPVGWAWDIINFVWWIGIGHAGTLISAILLLMRQRWRNSINRMAEAMTIFAVMCAGLFPLLHTGRPWVDYWLFPYPNIMGVWPNFRSPLIWDVFAVSTYFTVSVLFWYMGLVPDLASMRDRATNKYAKYAYALACLGWRGSNQHWHKYEQANLILAGISTPLVLSVHSIVSYDFAMSIIPGWQTTIFPPYFVAGAVYAGFAMVLMFAIPMRAAYRLKDLITMKHIDWMAKIMLTVGLIVAYGYATEAFYGLYSGAKSEVSLTLYRFHGEYRNWYYMLITCNCIIPQLLWIPKVRRNLIAVWIISLDINIGMWLERFVIIPMSLQINPVPAIDRQYHPTAWDFAMFAGTIGFFTMLMMLFIRALPTINMYEVKDLFYKMLKKGDAESKTPVPAGATE